MRNKFGGGFVLAEFAIALPLLILLGWGLAAVSVKTFQLGKDQLADYVLEAEAQHIIEQITKQARVAEEIEVKQLTDKIHRLKIIYHTLNERSDLITKPTIYNPEYYLFTIADVRETQYFIPHKDSSREIYDKLNAKRQLEGSLSNPISGDNLIGETKINRLQYDLDEDKKILHVTLELESQLSKHKIKIATAVFMPSYGS